MQNGGKRYRSYSPTGSGTSQYVLFQPPPPTAWDSYEIGDAGWLNQTGWHTYIRPMNPKVIAELDLSSPHWWFLLKNDLVVNGVANKLRFVGTTGIQTFPDNVVIDKLTGRMWQHTTNRISSFLNGISYAQGLTFAGFSDWQAAPISELHGLYYKEAATNNLTDSNTLVQLESHNSQYRSSTTTVPSNTANVYYIQRPQWVELQVQKTFGSGFYPAVRKCMDLITAP